MTSLTALVIGDPHIKITDLQASIEMTEAITRVAQEKKPDFIVCLGDTLDRHETIHTEPLTVATKWFMQLCQIAPVYLLIGNHDRVNNSDFLTDRHPFVGLKQWDYHRMTVVDTTTSAVIGDKRFFFVPYVPPGRFQEALDAIEWLPGGWTAGFSHQEFYGIKMGPIFSDKGDHWPLNYPLLINGHIHDRHLPQANIISIGTPRQHAFGEDPDKTISLFTFLSDDNYSEERISLNLPKKIVMRLSIAQFHQYQHPVEMIDHLKIEIQGNAAEIRTIIKDEKVKQLKKLGVKITTKDIEAGVTLRPSPLPSNEWIKKPFRDRLLIRIKQDDNQSNLMAAYRQLFGGKKQIIITRKKGVKS